MSQNIEYQRVWHKTHAIRVRMHKLRWYYRNRKVINMLLSKPGGREIDEADKWVDEHGKSWK